MRPVAAWLSLGQGAATCCSAVMDRFLSQLNLLLEEALSFHLSSFHDPSRQALNSSSPLLDVAAPSIRRSSVARSHHVRPFLSGHCHSRPLR